ncbi:MAG TPA: anhydro-N-acetylmuramic acid kinase [Bacteroidota bacterium]|nr:anhydro-N-acetylmuramic acid kinase [Bacteroidota bacterium]
MVKKVQRRNKRLVVGLMSGTSADGIDAVLVEVAGSGARTRFRRLAFETFPYPPGFKAFILKNSDPHTARLDDLARLNVLIALLFSDAAKGIIRTAGKTPSEVDLIGSHGQTIRHLPEPLRMFGRTVRSTLQIGSPAVIAKATGILTVGDFRLADIGVGGAGAPLVPYVDYLFLRSRRVNRLALNIGGIANVTVLPKNCSLDKVFAFDTGPGNMVIDSLTEIFFRKPFDAGGSIAAAGAIIPSLLAWMVRHPYLAKRPPKSTGREVFGKPFVKKLIRRAHGRSGRDMITTASEFTALSVYLGYRRFIRGKMKAQELLVSGGGARNPYIMDALRRYFSGLKISTTDETLLPADAKEAICFALLANETISGNTANVPGATGAVRPTILGTICPP